MSRVSEPSDEITVGGGPSHGFRDPPRISLGWLTVLVGPNNSGKTRLLQYLSQNVIQKQGRLSSDYFPPFRSRTRFEREMPSAQTEAGPAQRARTSAGSERNPEVAPDGILLLARLPERERGLVLRTFEDLFHHPVAFVRDPDNPYSAARPTIAGQLPSTEGSGSTSTLALLCGLFDPKLDWLFIDEPETGLEPRIQRRLMRLIQDTAYGSGEGPRKRIGIATHSHLFIDRDVPTNNRRVDIDTQGNVRVERVQSMADLRQLVFELLGNSVEDLFLPRAVVVVEGRSDREFLTAVLRLMQINSVLVYDAEGEARISRAVPTIEDGLKLLAAVSFRDRTFVICDRSHRKSQVEEWRSFLRDSTRLVELEMPAIEYHYPRTILGSISGLSADAIEDAISKYLNECRSFEDSGRRNPTPSLGKFTGAKVDLACAVGRIMTVEHLREVHPGIRELLRAANELTFL